MSRVRLAGEFTIPTIAENDAKPSPPRYCIQDASRFFLLAWAQHGKRTYVTDVEYDPRRARSKVER